MSDRQPLETFARDFPAGAVLFREGEDAHEMYVIQAGEVEIRRRIKDQDRTLAVLPAGEFFGEMAIVNNRPRSATAVVRTDARLLVIEGRTFEAMIRGKTEIAVRMIKTLAARLERANQQVELLLLRDANHRVVQCLRMMAERQVESGRDTPGAVYIPTSLAEIASRVALSEPEVAEVIERLASAHLVVYAADADVEGDGYVVPEVGQLLEFLEFLELKDRYGSI